MPLLLRMALLMRLLLAADSSAVPRNIGIQALLKVAGATSMPVDGFCLGFVLGPRINAGGRVGSAPDLGSRLLRTNDAKEAEAIAAELHALNEERTFLGLFCVLSAQFVEMPGREWKTMC